MDAAQLMDRQYRYQRYIYDWSRKYYLLGRDTLLQEMVVQPGETVLEIGCGTARNLLKMAYRFPRAKLFGVDASSAMLEVARTKLYNTLYQDRITLRQGLAGQFSYQDFGLEQPFDHVVFSYVLSMIPQWQGALEQSLPLLKPGGWLHIVDFSDQQGMPQWFRKLLLTWLDWFHVHPDPAMPGFLQQLADRQGDALSMRHIHGRYALLAHYRRQGEDNEPQPDIPHLSQYLDL